MAGFTKKFKNCDLFAYRPKLNYKGDKFTTLLGAILSTIFLVSLISYLIYLLVSMANRSTSYLNTHTFVRDVSVDDDGHLPADHGFDFALTIKYHDYKHLADLKELVKDKTIAIKAFQKTIIPPGEVGADNSIEDCKRQHCIYKILSLLT